MDFLVPFKHIALGLHYRNVELSWSLDLELEVLRLSAIGRDVHCLKGGTRSYRALVVNWRNQTRSEQVPEIVQTDEEVPVET